MNFVNFQIHNDSAVWPCTVCGAKKKPDEQRWNLTGYYGLTGTFCAECYEKVSHNAYGKPNHPEEYLLIMLKYK